MLNSMLFTCTTCFTVKMQFRFCKCNTRTKDSSNWKLLRECCSEVLFIPSTDIGGSCMAPKHRTLFYQGRIVQMIFWGKEICYLTPSNPDFVNSYRNPMKLFQNTFLAPKTFGSNRLGCQQHCGKLGGTTKIDDPRIIPCSLLPSWAVRIAHKKVLAS